MLQPKLLFSIVYLGLLAVVRLEASDEKGLAG